MRAGRFMSLKVCRPQRCHEIPSQKKNPKPKQNRKQRLKKMKSMSFSEHYVLIVHYQEVMFYEQWLVQPLKTEYVLCLYCFVVEMQ